MPGSFYVITRRLKAERANACKIRHSNSCLLTRNFGLVFCNSCKHFDDLVSCKKKSIMRFVSKFSIYAINSSTDSLVIVFVLNCNSLYSN